TRSQPGPEVLEEVKARVQRNLNDILKDKRPLGQISLHFLARAYFVDWTEVRDQPKTILQVTKGLDELYRRFLENPEIAQKEPGMYNGDWFGLGPAGDVIRLLID